MRASHFVAYGRYCMYRDQLKDALDVAAALPELEADALEVARVAMEGMEREAARANQEAEWNSRT